MDLDRVAGAVDEVAGVLRADGGDLILLDANPRTDRIHLSLVLESVSCQDCVLAPDLLYETIEQALHRHVEGEFELVVDDPRRANA
jgi:Fe-S cluster biogenesis protein NfuA